MIWYGLTEKEILHALGATENGLSGEEAGRRLAQYGPNRLVEEEKLSSLTILLHQFTSPLIYILLIAGVITVLLEEYIDSGVIFSVVVMNALIGFIHEHKAEESVRSLGKMVVPKAKVIRDSRELIVNSEVLVPGDIVLLASGARVPADLRLLHAIELKIDESMLTGESVPAEKVTSPLREDNLTPGDQRNMAFMGTTVVNGRARGVVTETGTGTVLGMIARNVREIGSVRAPLQDKINRFARMVGFLVLGASILLFFAGLLAGESVRGMFMIAVAGAVATIPEGLPIVVTIAMAIGVARMARQNAIIRKLPAVETLGSTSVIGSDKTGTLTRNEMTVRLVHDGAHTYEVTGSGYEPKGEILHECLPLGSKDCTDLFRVLRIGLLCNESNLYLDGDQYKIDGDPTEGALIVAAMKGGLRTEEEKKAYPLSAIVPFESERGFMATLHRHGAGQIIFAKGAPEKILDMCDQAAGAGPLDREEIEGTAEAFAREGLRVLALAYREAGDEMDTLTYHDVTAGLTFAGLQGMMDPPREEVIAAVEGCRQAGIRVIMITGDHAVTARAIAARLGLAGGDAEVVTGRDLEAMDDDMLYEAVRRVNVFARVSPEHKLRITEQLKRHGHIVAVTGDGVNDAPALKAAHIGIAMGRTGTDVAREASDMVLTDDNFASIFNAVKEGRIVFDNIRKVTFFLIPTGIAAILSIIGTIVMGVPIPYVPAQLLWINLVTNGLQDVALAFEPGEKEIIQRPPRDPGEGIMTRVLVERTVLIGLLISAGVVVNFMTSLEGGNSLEKARTVAVTTMVFFQFFQAWNARSETQSVFTMNPFSNPFLFFSMLAAFLAQLAVIYVPVFQWIFRTEPISAAEWLRILGVSSTVILVIEADKLLRRTKAKQTAGIDGGLEAK
ncbi:MAG: HAD-IC family P-type ATPase [Desulfobulbaceae bacterium]|jgi:Ca2+-transporting ATPase|nr:HAD-IC family P-type ATPase [Desulfobulbaceae bacterium]